MNKYAVAVLSFFENENKVYIVNGDNKVEAMLRGITEFNKKDNIVDKDTEEWINSMKNNTVDEIKTMCFDGELAISEPIQIK